MLFYFANSLYTKYIIKIFRAKNLQVWYIFCNFAPQKFIYTMSREQSNRIAYLVACVGAFAERHGLTNQSSYQYLRLYKGTDFLRDYYDIEHTFSIDEAVEDLTVICQRNGGALA